MRNFVQGETAMAAILCNVQCAPFQHKSIDVSRYIHTFQNGAFTFTWDGYLLVFLRDPLRAGGGRAGMGITTFSIHVCARPDVQMLTQQQNIVRPTSDCKLPVCPPPHH